MSEPTTEPLASITSIKVKLGLLVAVSVAVAAIVATLGARGGVPALLGIPVTIALALGVTQLLAVGMTSPLREMTKAARAMAAGDYSGRIQTGSRDEIGDLAAAFNVMAFDLAEVDRERRDLVANVSHELRTPLTALSARLENLADGVEAVTPAALAETVDQSRRLSVLVSDLLDLSRLDAGLTELNTSSIQVSEFLASVVADVAAMGRLVSVEVDVSNGLKVDGDPVRLRQLATNLVVNAVRHSPDGGTVRVSARLLETPEGGRGAWALEISDQGPGIAVEDRERVFERFGTLAGHVGGGTGLGLAIARWVATLHGGTVRFVDPLESSGDPAGARVRVELPLRPPPPSFTATPVVEPTPSTLVSVAGKQPTSSFPDLWGSFWPQRDTTPRRDLLLAAGTAGVLAAALIPFHRIGLGLWVVVLVSGGIVLSASPHRGSRETQAAAGLAALLATVAVVREAEWIVVLCLLAGALVMTVSLTQARTVSGFVLSAICWPLAALRGLPWLGDSLNALGGRNRVAPLVRTAVLSVLAAGVFGLLFASADPVLAAWVRRVLPDWSFTRLVLRAFIAVAVGGAVLAASYLALNPPRVTTDGAAARTTGRRYEWLAPVGLVNVVFLAFLLAQATVIFGGHDYLRRTTGLTYAEYVHQGFGQLTVATALTLVVVWAAARKADREDAAERLWLRASLGLLCVSTLVVVASAMYRMALYQQAYGYTRLRLLVDVFEGWLGFVVLTVLVAGVSLRGALLPRIALYSGACALAGLALSNPDAFIARENIGRYQQTERIDWYYLDSLSADALPVLAQLPEADLRCLAPPLEPEGRSVWGWTWGYERARGLEIDAPSAISVRDCT